MSKSLPEVGDFVEVEGDWGCAPNAPWMQKVVEIEGDMYYFNEGTESKPYLVGYKINQANFDCIGKNRYENNAPVFIYTH